MSLDRNTVKVIADLARLRVDDDQLDALALELSSILHFVEQLDEVDTRDVAPMASVAASTLPMRSDTVTDGGNPEAILANAPLRIDGYFAVPKVVE